MGGVGGGGWICPAFHLHVSAALLPSRRDDVAATCTVCVLLFVCLPFDAPQPDCSTGQLQ